MQFPKFPDWLLYASVAAAILVVAAGRRENAGAPPPPPPVPGEADTPLDPALPFDPAQVVDIPRGSAAIATAFSIAERGVWLTSAEAVQGCRRPAVIVAEGRGVLAAAKVAGDGVAILTTKGGGRPLGLRDSSPLRSGERGFLPGFPAGPGEASARFLGGTDQASRVWAETGRTEGLTGGLRALAGAPVIDELGRVAGLVLASSRRRGTFRSTGPNALSSAAATAGALPVRGAEQAIDTTNYSRVADRLRRDLSVVEVRCLQDVRR